jgi:ligand-binding sensor domain-containing protein
MKKACGRIHNLRFPGVLLPALLFLCPRSLALNPALDLSQYAHTAWKIRDGFPKGIINSIAQTPDGYLWLGTEFGLIRFDGNRAVPWQPPQGQNLGSSDIRALLTARDGTLWIGTAKGLASRRRVGRRCWIQFWNWRGLKRALEARWFPSLVQAEFNTAGKGRL